MSDVDRLLADYIAEHRAGGEADPREYLSRASPAQRTELAALIDAYLARAPRQQFDRSDVPRLERRAHRRRARARDRRPGRAVARAAAPPARPCRAQAQRTRRAARRGARRRATARTRSPATTTRWSRACCPPQGVSDRVLEALGRIVGETAQALRDAGRALTPSGEGPGRAGGRVRPPRLRRTGRRPRRRAPNRAAPASGTRSTSCSAAPDVRFRPPIRPSR